MPWNAKPDYGYTITSTEGTQNIQMINGFMNEHGYQLAAQAGLIACIANEGALNPWLWGYGYPAMYGDPMQSAQGYGLFQFTPWGKYVDNPSAMSLDGYGPNKSRDYITTGARPEDGWAQMLYYETLPGWNDWIWRSYWYAGNPICYDYGIEPLTQAEEDYYRGITNGAISRWGSDGMLTKAQFKNISIIEDAVMAFLGGYEGPLVPRYYGTAVDLARGPIWSILSGDTPPDPPGPGPHPGGRGRKMPLWMYLRKY